MSTIRITYSTHVVIDLQEVCDELNVSSREVKTVTTCGNVITVVMNDGSFYLYEFDPAMICDGEMDDQNPTTKIV
tara:strand:+ start:1385 stop:1609 length:225 start_codon:yes stop_codon:yes gene_type:complete